MNYETVVAELFRRFPNIRTAYEIELPYMLDEAPLPYIVFGSILIPTLQEAMSYGQLAKIVPICAFLEDVSVAAQNDQGLWSLVAIEVGEWLGCVAHEEMVAPWLGPCTKQICGYVPGLATQRRTVKAVKDSQSTLLRLWKGLIDS